MKELLVPGDKSISHRSVLFGAVAQGETEVENFLTAGDTLHSLQAVEALGVKVRREGSRVWLTGKGFAGLRQPTESVYLGNSGTGARLLLGLLAGSDLTVTLDGDASLRKRPMRRVAEPLGQMGAQFRGADDATRLPLTVEGHALQGIHYDLPVASAQVKSALLLAGLQASGVTSLKEPGKSRDHTERLLEYFGAPLTQTAERIEITAGPLKAQPIKVPGDISSAAFFLVGTAISPDRETVIRNVGLNPTRTGVLDVLRAMGADITIENQHQIAGEEQGDIIVRGGALRGTVISPEIIPRLIDELPILALAAACAEGTTRVSGARELRVKESDRIAVLVREFKRLGVTVKEFPDGFAITGPAKFTGGDCECAHDHRIAMTLLMANLVSDGEIRVPGSGPYIETSFPGFQEVFNEWAK